jgi:phospholipid/cholesterol/gamma-HCH transport system ATP-binding protein
VTILKTNSELPGEPGGPKNTVLSFKSVSTEPAPFFDTPLWDVSFTLSQAELLLVRMERGRFRLPLADLAAGILEPVDGVVEFLGKDWQEMTADDAAMQRGKVGRVFENLGWITFLDVGQNITLAQRHHSTRTDSDIEAEAIHLARLFGLPGLPHTLVSKARREDLNRAAFIRAFLGRPALIILERPTRDLLPGILSPLINAVRLARNQGSAIIWTTSEDLVWRSPDIDATLKCTMFGSRMNVVEEEK